MFSILLILILKEFWGVVEEMLENQIKTLYLLGQFLLQLHQKYQLSVNYFNFYSDQP
jgi:hypothetical protein